MREETNGRRKGMNRTAIVTTAAILALASCAAGPELSDSEHIENLIAGSAFSEMDPLTSRGGEGERSLEAPEGWFRQKTAESEPELTLWNDPAAGVCTLTVQRTLEGVLNIDVVHDGQWEPGQKTIDDIRTRHIIVERTGEEADPHGGWTLRAISVGEHCLSQEAAADQEVFVSAFRIYVEGELAWQADDPWAFYDVEGGLPQVEESDLLRVEAEFLHENPLYDPPLLAFVHGPCPVWPRHPLNDEGLYGDRNAGDGTYSYEWYAEDVRDRSFVAVDVLDAETMNDQTEDDYDSSAWGIRLAK